MSVRILSRVQREEAPFRFDMFARCAVHEVELGTYTLSLPHFLWNLRGNVEDACEEKGCSLACMHLHVVISVRRRQIGQL